MLGVAWNGTDDAMVDFEQRHGLSFPSLRDESGELFARFGVPAQPAWVFVSANGEADTSLGALGEAELDAAFGRLATP